MEDSNNRRDYQKERNEIIAKYQFRIDYIERRREELRQCNNVFDILRWLIK